jgi:hypothetical protein
VDRHATVDQFQAIALGALEKPLEMMRAKRVVVI